MAKLDQRISEIIERVTTREGLELVRVKFFGPTGAVKIGPGKTHLKSSPSVSAANYLGGVLTIRFRQMTVPPAPIS